MSDTTPASTKKVVKGWTDHEKLGLLFQIIAKAGTVPWAELDLPEGRTVKACSVMLDKEKAKFRKAKEAVAAAAAGGGEDVAEGETPLTPVTPTAKEKKRAGDDDISQTTAKKPKTPRKSKKMLKAEADAEAAAAAAGGEGEEGNAAVKVEASE